MNRWLVAAVTVSGAYILVTGATALDGQPNVPPQVNMAILHGLSLAVLIPAIGELIRRREARILAAVRRDIAMLRPTQPLRQIPVAVPATYRSGTGALEPEWVARDDEIRDFLARQLMDPPDDEPA
jgi:hypothetical protein